VALGGEGILDLACEKGFLVSAIKIESVRHAGEGQTDKYFKGQVRWCCKTKREHQKPPWKKPSADVGKPQTCLCFGADQAQDKPLAQGEKQNGIDPDDGQAVGDQREPPVFSISKNYVAATCVNRCTTC